MVEAAGVEPDSLLIKHLITLNNFKITEYLLNRLLPTRRCGGENMNGHGHSSDLSPYPISLLFDISLLSPECTLIRTREQVTCCINTSISLEQTSVVVEYQLTLM
jgi:hypothetical protein